MDGFQTVWQYLNLVLVSSSLLRNIFTWLVNVPVFLDPEEVCKKMPTFLHNLLKFPFSAGYQFFFGANLDKTHFKIR